MPPPSPLNALPRVLVVDDEEHIRQVARRVLEGERYQMTEGS